MAHGGGGETVLLIQLKRVGDVLLCTPLVRALRKDRPDRRILFLTEPHNHAVLRGNPAVDALIACPTPMGMGDWGNLVRRLRAERIDWAIDLSGTPRSCLLAALSGARARSGFRVRLPRRWAYNRVVVPDRSKYTVDRRLDLLRAAGVADAGFQTEIHLDDADRAAARALLRDAGFPPDGVLIAVAPTSRRPAKRWDPVGFARAAAELRTRVGGEILLLSGSGEEDQEEEVRRAIPGGARRLPRVPELRTLAALLERSRILICNDGGPKHLAVAVGTPTVTIFTSSSIASWHPPGDPRHVAIAAHGSIDLEIDRVVEEASGLLS